jgi:hypothetical protein
MLVIKVGKRFVKMKAVLLDAGVWGAGRTVSA